MTALSRWRSKVKHLTKKEKEKDLRRSCNIEAFKEFKEKRAEQQRKRRAKKKHCGTTTHKTHKIHKTHKKHGSRTSRISPDSARRNRAKRIEIMRGKKVRRVSKISVPKITSGTKCVQFIHLNKKEPRGSKEFVFYVNAKFFEKIGVKISQQLYTEGDGSAHKLIRSMINEKTKGLFKAPSSRSVESYVQKGKNSNQRMDYAFFLLFDFLHDKSYVTGHAKDGFEAKYPRHVIATVISQGGSVM